MHPFFHDNVTLRYLLNEKTLFTSWWRSAIKEVNDWSSPRLLSVFFFCIRSLLRIVYHHKLSSCKTLFICPTLATSPKIFPTSGLSLHYCLFDPILTDVEMKNGNTFHEMRTVEKIIIFSHTKLICLYIIAAVGIVWFLGRVWITWKNKSEEWQRYFWNSCFFFIFSMRNSIADSVQKENSWFFLTNLNFVHFLFLER